MRSASAGRGFAELKVLTDWAAIAGPALGPVTRPVKVAYGRGFGATLTLEVAGARIAEIRMQTEALRERVNAAYGYGAIGRIVLRRAPAAGFAEAAAPAPTPPPADPAALRRVEGTVAPCEDPALKAALTRLGRAIVNRKD